jgi:hypothetical protein
MRPSPAVALFGQNFLYPVKQLLRNYWLVFSMITFPGPVKITVVDGASQDLMDSALSDFVSGLTVGQPFDISLSGHV